MQPVSENANRVGNGKSCALTPTTQRKSAKRKAQKKRVAEHPECWRQDHRRRNHDMQPRPGYSPAETEVAQVAKKDSSTAQIPLRAGPYWIQTIAPIDPTKNHAFMAEIHFVSSTWLTSTKSDGIDASLLAAYLPLQHLPRSRHPHTVAPRHLC